MKNIYEEIVAYLPVPICRFLPEDGTLTLVNDAYCRYFGKDRTELLGSSIFEVMPPEECGQVRERIHSLSPQNPSVTYEHTVVTPLGIRWVGRTDQGLFDDQGSLREVQSLCEDRTDTVFARNELRITENRYQTIFETTATANLITDHDTIVLVNREFEKLTGYRKCQVEGTMTWHRVVHADDRERFMSALGASLRSHRAAPEELEFRITDSRGDTKTVLARCHGVRGTSQVVTSLLDITRRKEWGQILENSEEKYRQVVENANEYIVVVQDEQVRYLNRKARSLPCLHGGDLLGTSFLTYIHPDDAAMVWDYNTRRMQGGEVPNIYTFRIRDHGKRTFIVENNAVLIQWEGRPATLNFLTDITDARRMEEELRQSEERNRLYLENATDIIFILDSDLRIQSISPRVYDILGITAGEIMNLDISRLNILKPEYLPKLHEEISKVMQGERITSSMYEITNREGRDIIIEVSLAPHFTDHRITDIICVARDVTERTAMEDSLRRSEKRYREILEDIEDGYYEVDLRGNFTFFNHAMCKILGYLPADMTGLNNRSFMDEKTARRVFRAFNQVYLTGEHDKASDWELIRKDGSRCFVETSVSLLRDDRGQPVGFRGIARNVTDRRNLENQLAQSQKMEAIGTLAGGIAHDFNNILAAIAGYTELALMDLKPESPLQSKLEEVLKAAKRAKDLVNQILTFSRKGDYEKRPLKMAMVADEALKMLRASLPSSIEIVSDLGARDTIVQADPTQIHQIILNLCTNAYHAVRDTGGIIRVELSEQDLRKGTFLPDSGMRQGRYVVLSITDTGCGMSQDVMERIFDPYYTTKPKGEGTGLGLAIVHGIVRSLGGGISVRSMPGQGSSFHIYLPMVSSGPLHEAGQAEHMPCGRERVLVIDDEKNIVEVTRQMLERLGYRVTTHQSSTEALDHFARNAHGYDLVISDLTMPKMNGDQLARKMVEIKPDIPIIICTGFSDLMPGGMVGGTGIRDVLVKPVMLNVLARTVRRVLDERPV
jgi:PAS domain S-box-containing protein